MNVNFKPNMAARDRWIPWMFVLFFVVVGSVDAVMVTMAVRTNTGIVTEKAYEKGLAYNDNISAAAAQAAWGWHTQAAIDSGRFVFNIKDNNRNGLDRAVVQVRMTRPVSAGHDFNLFLTEQGDGSYAAQADFPMKGEWQAKVFVKWQDKQYQSTHMLMVR
jgi:nitrogen fixation protein FixH